MQSLVENLLQQARLENRLEIARRPVPVDALFQRLAEEREIALAAKK
jgi:two-component system sensor histidine kinase CreC